jgi:two-component system OmpR family response regulator
VRVLVVEDDPRVRRQVASALERAGYAIDVAADGHEGSFLGETETYDAVVLDLSLPGTDGVRVLEGWRARDVRVPVLVLSARGTWREKVTGLRAGADDYLAKPFELEELLARVDALVRRAAGQASTVVECGRLHLDTSSQLVTLDGMPLALTALEYRLLALLMRHPRRVFSKGELTERLYDQDFDRDSNVIEVLVNRVRKKLGAELIETRRGQGYALVAGDAG